MDQVLLIITITISNYAQKEKAFERAYILKRITVIILRHRCSFFMALFITNKLLQATADKDNCFWQLL
jgi:hypothetical protein